MTKRRCDDAQGVALGLAACDSGASPLGRQPMTSVEQRYTLIFQRRIYNYRDLKAELIKAGHSFRGDSDTEVILAGFSQWGIERTFES